MCARASSPKFLRWIPTMTSSKGVYTCKAVQFVSCIFHCVSSSLHLYSFLNRILSFGLIYLVGCLRIVAIE